MKINPENIITDEDLCLKYKSFFISGNDESYIFALVDMLVKNFTKNGYVRKNLNNNDDLEPDLFKVESKYVYVSDKYSGDRYVEGVEANKDVLIFYEKSLAKNRSIKQFFSTSKERALLECYQLDQGKKKIILNGFIKKNELVFENSVYWLLLDLLDNRYAILIKELEKVLLLNNKVDMLEIANVLNIGRSTDANKFFFKIHLSRTDITSFINSSVNSLTDFYNYFSYFKTYSLLMFGSKNTKDLENKIPKYLFKEKKGFLSLFSSLNENKIKLLSSLMFKTEKLVRKNPELYKPLFFRFVLNYKRIIS